MDDKAGNNRKNTMVDNRDENEIRHDDERSRTFENSFNTSTMTEYRVDTQEEENIDPLTPGAFYVISQAEGERPAWIQEQMLQDNESDDSSSHKTDESPGNISHSEQQSVLSPYLPSPFHGQNNAVVVEVDRTHSKKAINKKKWMINILLLLGVAAIAIGLGVGLRDSKTEHGGKDSTDIFAHGECEFADPQDISNALSGCICEQKSTDLTKVYKNQYELLKTTIINQTGLGLTSTSLCEPTNIALFWLTIDTVKNSLIVDEGSLVRRFVLALCFQSWHYFQKSWIREDGWMTSDNECVWFGIICDENDEILSISLPKNRLSGSIPTEIALFGKLSTLNLNTNSIVGSIPTELGRLDSLMEFDVGMNQIDAHIPTELGKLTLLENLSLASNRFDGSLPVEIGNLTSARYINVASNQLSGNIPTSIAYCSELRLLSFSSNRFTGTIPNEIFVLSEMESLSFKANNFGGSIPFFIENLKNLTFVTFEDNVMNGTIPTTIGLCTSLQDLRLGVNRFTGEIPTEIGSLQELQSLLLGYNRFTGSVPSQLGKCQNLTHLDVSENVRMEGAMPSELSHLSNLQYFNFESIGLIGTIPDEICFMLDVGLTKLRGNCVKCDCCTNC